MLTPEARTPSSTNDSASRALESTSKNLIDQFNKKSHSSQKSSAPGNLLDSEEQQGLSLPLENQPQPPPPGPSAGTAAPDSTAAPDTSAAPTPVTAPTRTSATDPPQPSPAPPTPAPGPTAGPAARDTSPAHTASTPGTAPTLTATDPTAGPDTGAPATLSGVTDAPQFGPTLEHSDRAPRKTPPEGRATKPTSMVPVIQEQKSNAKCSRNADEFYAAAATSQHTTTSTAQSANAVTRKSSTSDEFQTHATLGFAGLFDDVEDIVGTNNTVDNGGDDDDDDAFMAKIHNKMNEGLPKKKKYKVNYDVEYNTVPSPDPHMHPQTLRSIPLHLYDVVGKPANYKLQYLMRHKYCGYPWNLYANCRVMRSKCHPFTVRVYLRSFVLCDKHHDNYALCRHRR